MPSMMSVIPESKRQYAKKDSPSRKQNKYIKGKTWRALGEVDPRVQQRYGARMTLDLVVSSRPVAVRFPGEPRPF